MTTFQYLVIEEGVCAPKGFYASGVHCGLRKNKNRPDLALIYSDVLCQAAAVYTQNKVKGAPIYITQKHLTTPKAQAVIVNSGNANTCNADGEEKATIMCETIAKELGIAATDVIVASTGIIGESLPVEKIVQACPELKNKLAVTGNDEAANAILTTDTCKKEFALEFLIGGKKVTMGGIAKGSGMIHPNMATMLCFLTTDVNIHPELLQKALKEITDETFNMISVDGDTSTNDMVSILASGQAENPLISTEDSLDFKAFKEALFIILRYLSRAIAQDGEGASKLLECRVVGASELLTARKIAKSVITSSLVKSAMFGEDPNWGRILCAIGYTEADFDINQVNVTFASDKGQAIVCQNGRGVDFEKMDLGKILKADEIQIFIDLQAGNEEATAWGCDLTYDYVKINADYHT